MCCISFRSTSPEPEILIGPRLVPMPPLSTHVRPLSSHSALHTIPRSPAARASLISQTQQIPRNSQLLEVRAVSARSPRTSGTLVEVSPARASGQVIVIEQRTPRTSGAALSVRDRQYRVEQRSPRSPRASAGQLVMRERDGTEYFVPESAAVLEVSRQNSRAGRPGQLGVARRGENGGLVMQDLQGPRRSTSVVVADKRRSVIYAVEPRASGVSVVAPDARRSIVYRVDPRMSGVSVRSTRERIVVVDGKGVRSREYYR